MRRRLSRLVGCALLAAVSSAHAAPGVLVRASTRDLEPAVDRVCAELASAGYAVSFELSGAPTQCLRGPAGSEVAWIQLAPKPDTSDVVLATICFDGTVVVVGGARSEPVRFAVSAAEALNGLRATAPSLRSRRPAAPPVPESSGAARLAAPPARRSFSFSQTLIVDPRGFPALWGSSLELELSLTRHATFAFAGFAPLSRAELSGAGAELEAALAFVRAGPGWRSSFHGFAFGASLTFGPALTWVKASSVRRYVGGTDHAFGVSGATGLGVLYPSRGPVFAVAAGRASLLLPAPRFLLPEAGSRDWGPLLLEMSLGLGLRF